MSVLSEEFRIGEIDRDSDVLLVNLFEHYLHDMAPWFGFDTLQNGSYAMDTSRYWDAGARPFVAYAGALPIGFAIVGSAPEWHNIPAAADIEEFFVIRRHRRAGVGAHFASDIWNRFPGPWLVRVYQRNRPALPFWRTTIAGYTGNTHTEQTRLIDAKPWSVFSFDSAADAGR